MAVYSVHEPPVDRKPERRGPEHFAFVRDGFHFWAFLLTPFWLIWRRLWLVLLGWIVVSAVLIFVLHLAGAGPGAQLGAQVLLSLLVALEAGSLQRWTLRRRRWHDLGIVVADGIEAAERRFFDAWTRENDPVRPTPAPPPPPPPAFGGPPPRRPGGPEVVGLFPEPGAGR